MSFWNSGGLTKFFEDSRSRLRPWFHEIEVFWISSWIFLRPLLWLGWFPLVLLTSSDLSSLQLKLQRRKGTARRVLAARITSRFSVDLWLISTHPVASWEGRRPKKSLTSWATVVSYLQIVAKIYGVWRWNIQLCFSPAQSPLIQQRSSLNILIPWKQWF